MVTSEEIEELQIDAKRLKGAVSLVDSGIDAALHNCDSTAVKAVLERALTEAEDAISDMRTTVSAIPWQRDSRSTSESDKQEVTL